MLNLKNRYIMKNYYKVLLVAVLGFMVTNVLAAQDYRELKHSPELLLGKWRATIGNMTYEVEFTTEILSDKKNNKYEYILGKIIYKNHNAIIKRTEYDDVNSIIYGRGMRSLLKANLEFCDNNRLVWWSFEFTIDENDNTKAVWTFLKPYEDWMEMGWNAENRPDIPDGLTFHKVTGGVPDNPVEGEILL